MRELLKFCFQGSMDAGNSGARADSGSAGAAGKPEDNQALTEEALHLKRIQVCNPCSRPAKGIMTTILPPIMTCHGELGCLCPGNY